MIYQLVIVGRDGRRMPETMMFSVGEQVLAGIGKDDTVTSKEQCESIIRKMKVNILRENRWFALASQNFHTLYGDVLGKIDEIRGRLC